MRRPKYRVTIYDLSTGTSAKIADFTGEAYHVAVGHDEANHFIVDHSSSGHPDLLRDLAQIIADHPTGREP